MPLPHPVNQAEARRLRGGATLDRDLNDSDPLPSFTLVDSSSISGWTRGLPLRTIFGISAAQPFADFGNSRPPSTKRPLVKLQQERTRRLSFTPHARENRQINDWRWIFLLRYMRV
jgi:hypothetical protein